MYVMDKLWRGEIFPAERRIRSGSKYQKAAHEVCEKIEGFLGTLTPETRKQFEEISDLKSDLNLMENEDFFIYGFRLGAGMVLDIIRDYKGAFRERAEET